MDANWFLQNFGWEAAAALIMTAMARIYRATTGKTFKEHHATIFWLTGTLGIFLVLMIIHFGVIRPLFQQLSSERPIAPNLQSEIGGMSTGSTKDGAVNVTLLVRVLNSGGPSVAWKWHLRVDLTTGQSVEADASMEPISISLGSSQSSNNMVLDAGHYLPNELMEAPLPSGNGRLGWVTFIFNDISQDDLSHYGNKFTLQFQDVDGKIIECSYTVNTKPFKL